MTCQCCGKETGLAFGLCSTCIVVEDIMVQLPRLDTDDDALIRNEVRALYNSRWSKSEILRYVQCIENVNPDLDEDVAIKRMMKIRLEVEQRLQS